MSRSGFPAFDPKKDKFFVRGPIPLSWLASAARLPGKALQVGLAIWFRAGCCRSDTVKLTTRIVETFGVSRQARYRAIKNLAEARLIDVSQEKGQLPVVRILRGAGDPS